MEFEPTHQHRRNGIPVQVVADVPGCVTYFVPWSAFPMTKTQTEFEKLYEPISDG